MAVSLVKGQKVDLTKGNAGLDQIVVGLGWDAQVASKGLLGGLFGGAKNSNIDCDTAAIMLDGSGRLGNNRDVIYFGNLSHTTDSVRHMGDNLTGEGAGDDEQIFMQLSRVPSHIERIVFVVNIYDCVSRKQDFGMIKNAYIRIMEPKTQKELIRFNLSEDYKGYTALIVGEVYRRDGEWKFAALGTGTKDVSLKNMLSQYV